MMVGAGPIALGYFDAGLLAAAAVALGAALQFSVPGVRAPRNPMHLAFAGLCACIAVLALANVALDRATDSAQAVRAVRWMCAAAVLSFPAIVGFVGDYTGSPVRGLRINIVCAVALGFFLINLYAPRCCRGVKHCPASKAYPRCGVSSSTRLPTAYSFGRCTAASGNGGAANARRHCCCVAA